MSSTDSRRKALRQFYAKFIAGFKATPQSPEIPLRPDDEAASYYVVRDVGQPLLCDGKDFESISQLGPFWESRGAADLVAMAGPLDELRKKLSTDDAAMKLEVSPFIYQMF